MSQPAHRAAWVAWASLVACAPSTSPDVRASPPTANAGEEPAPTPSAAPVASVDAPTVDASTVDASVAEPRLGWPEDKQLSGVYAHIGMIGAPSFPKFLGQLATNGMNAVVVDGKDYSGWLTYPSSIPLAVETHAAAHAVLKSLQQLVHEAHQRGVRVILRVACFHDPWMAQHRPALAIRGVGDWLDPNNPGAQDYLLAVVDETMATGVDEIELDYVRYPTEGIGHASFGLPKGKTTVDSIASFVARVHEHTKAAGVPLSLAVFGVVAWQRAPDVNATGQDLSRLGAVVEALSPMVYPSHFAKGFNGYEIPGAHPEVVAFGTKQAVDVLAKSGSTAVVRPWIQAFPWHAPGYDASYVLREIAQARAAGGIGWLGWNAGGYYGEVMAAAWQTRQAVKAR